MATTTATRGDRQFRNYQLRFFFFFCVCGDSAKSCLIRFNVARNVPWGVWHQPAPSRIVIHLFHFLATPLCKIKSNFLEVAVVLFSRLFFLSCQLELRHINIYWCRKQEDEDERKVVCAYSSQWPLGPPKWHLWAWR